MVRLGSAEGGMPGGMNPVREKGRSPFCRKIKATMDEMTSTMMFLAATNHNTPLIHDNQ